MLGQSKPYIKAQGWRDGLLIKSMYLPVIRTRARILAPTEPTVSHHTCVSALNQVEIVGRDPALKNGWRLVAQDT